MTVAKKSNRLLDNAANTSATKSQLISRCSDVWQQSVDIGPDLCLQPIFLHTHIDMHAHTHAHTDTHTATHNMFLGITGYYSFCFEKVAKHVAGVRFTIDQSFVEQ